MTRISPTSGTADTCAQGAPAAIRATGPARRGTVCGYLAISSESAATNPSTSASEVSKEHIQRTTPVASSQK